MSNRTHWERSADDSPVLLVMGGSFAPLHYGHVHAARSVRQDFIDHSRQVVDVFLVPAWDKWVHEKLSGRNVPLEAKMDEQLRIRMCKAANVDIPWLKAADHPWSSIR